VRVGVLVEACLDEEAFLRDEADDLIRRLDGGDPVQPAIVVVEAARLVDRGQHVEAVNPRELEVLSTAAGRDVDDAGALVERDVVPGDHPMLDLPAWADVVEGRGVAPADQLFAALALHEPLLGIPADRDPVAVLASAVLSIGLHRGGDVRRDRPRRRRPDHKRLLLAIEQWQTDVERRIGAVLVDARLRELVLRERGAAPRAPFGRAVAHVEPAVLVHPLQQPPDVLDVRVAEGEVVAAPVHPLSEPLRAARELLRGPDDDLAAAARELGEAVLLDLTLRVEAQLALDPHLDPEPLAVEPVLVALVVAAQGLVALEDVLERAPPRRVHRERLVRGHRAVDEAEPGPALVLPPQALEGLLPLPELEDLELERGVIGLVRQGCEHALDSREQASHPCRFEDKSGGNPLLNQRKEIFEWQLQSKRTRSRRRSSRATSP
jgi:hypothetical protein